MPLHRPSVRASAAPLVSEGEPQAVTAAVEPLIQHILRDGSFETDLTARAWDMYEMPEVRNACRQYSNAFASAKLQLGRREVPWKDPVPITDPKTDEEKKAYELLESFAGGPVGQTELLDRMGTYFMVPGDMALVGAYDPMLIAENKFARWDVWSTGELKWTGRQIRIREHLTEDVWETQPDYIKHVRIWNRHPHYGWLPDSPVMSSLRVLELIGLYDDRMAAEAISRLINAGVWFLPQGLNLPSVTGKPGGPQDFLELMKLIGSIAMKDRRSAAATLPVLVEAAIEDIEAAVKGHVDLSTTFSEHVGELQKQAIGRWASGVDLPPEAMLGMSSATHWNASLISEDKNQSFVIPSLRRAVGNLTVGWFRPAMRQFDKNPGNMAIWFDPSGIKTRVDTTEEAQWASDRFLIGEDDTKFALGLSQTPKLEGDELKRAALLHMMREVPESVPDVLRELGIDVKMPGAAETGLRPRISPDGSKPNGNGRSGPQAANGTDATPLVSGPGRAAQLGTRRD